MPEEEKANVLEGNKQHMMRAQDWQQLGLHAARDQVIVALVVAGFLPTILLAQLHNPL